MQISAFEMTVQAESKELRIAMGVASRTAKEFAMYNKEAKAERDKLEKMQQAGKGAPPKSSSHSLSSTVYPRTFLDCPVVPPLSPLPPPPPPSPPRPRPISSGVKVASPRPLPSRRRARHSPPEELHARVRDDGPRDGQAPR